MEQSIQNQIPITEGNNISILEFGNNGVYIWKMTEKNIFSCVGTVEEKGMPKRPYKRCYVGEVAQKLEKMGYKIVVEAGSFIEVSN